MTEQGEVWAEFVDSELSREFERRSALDTKGLAVVTSSGTLVTLIFAIGALAIGRNDVNFVPSGVVVVPAIIGLGLFILAAIISLVGTRTHSYSVADVSSLTVMRNAQWGASPTTALNIVMWYKIDTLGGLRDGNDKKTKMITVGLSVQVAAIVSLAVAIGSALLGA